MYSINFFAFVFVFLPIIIASIASPLSPLTDVTSSDGNGLNLNVRQSKVLSDIIDAICNQVVNDILNTILNFDSNMQAAESYFTQHTVTSLWAQYPGKNILIFHNQNSLYHLSPDAVHLHYELDIGLGFTQGYEIWVFDYGTFSLAGDGGYENLAYEGCYSGPDINVIFTQC